MSKLFVFQSDEMVTSSIWPASLVDSNTLEYAKLGSSSATYPGKTDYYYIS